MGHEYTPVLAALTSLVIASACGPGTPAMNQASPTASTASLSATPSDKSCPSPSPAPNSAFATYSFNRVTFQYPTSWRLQPPSPGGSIFFLYSPDYKDSGGPEIQTIQQGARMVFSQTDLPRKDITADNYPTSNRAGYLDGHVVVITCRKAFQLRQSNKPWWESTSTIFFRDDGTEVEVGIDYPSGMPMTHPGEYGQLLSSLVY